MTSRVWQARRGRSGQVGRYRQLLSYVRQWPARTWAAEGANGIGRPLAARLLADGESVVDVPAKLAARVRVFDVGHAPQNRRHRRPLHRDGGATHQGSAAARQR
jgi:hypothetical protein